MTIFALSTAPGRAGIAVIRMSGRDAKPVLTSMLRSHLPKPRTASLRTIIHPATREIIDRGLVLWFPAPSSFTGEDVAEFHIHGGRAVIDAIADALSSEGVRLAEPGEFTKRAFENGKLDLTEAEGLADLVDAQTAAQHRQALAQSGGALRKRYDGWRTSLLQAMALVEASLDFTDEADVAADAFAMADPIVRHLAHDLEAALAAGRGGELVREGIRVAIAGAPNVGKSSLLNVLAGREAAIVFDEPGTTRDVIEAPIDIGGFPFVFLDTAGMRDTCHAVEREGIRRALAAVETADIVLHVCDTSSLFWPGLPDTPEGHLQEGAAVVLGHDRLFIINKIDTDPAFQPPDGTIAISAKTGSGLKALKSSLVTFAKARTGDPEAVIITRARHRECIAQAYASLTGFLADGLPGENIELQAEDLRAAAHALGKLAGAVNSDEVLGAIFSSFCIGK